MYGCFWCSVQGHLIKGECTLVTEGRAAFACYFPLGQRESNINFGEIYTSAPVAEREGGAGYFPSEQSHDTYASPSVQVMHACSLVRFN